jgi:ATP-dependent DNA ligase
VDRKNKFSYVPQLRFPIAGNLQAYHNETIVDGELVTDQEPDGSQVVRYLAFDLLAYNGQNIIKKPLRSRLAVSSDFALGDKTRICSRRSSNTESRKFDFGSF